MPFSIDGHFHRPQSRFIRFSPYLYELFIIPSFNLKSRTKFLEFRLNEYAFWGEIENVDVYPSDTPKLTGSSSYSGLFF